MDLYLEILGKMLEWEQAHIVFPQLNLSAAEIVEGACYKALKQIKDLIEDESLDDPECFMKIEEVVCLLEKLGSDGGFRHDFG